MGGHDKHWADNLIIFPDRWAGNPCVMIWGGENHHFVNNECVVGDGTGSGDNSPPPASMLPDPVGLDGTRVGAKCTLDFKNQSVAHLIGHIHDNKYWTQDGEWAIGCGNATNPGGDHRWTLAEMKANRQATGSVVNKASTLTVAMLEAKARAKL